uniref:Uncharacterized protein n=1 Tax=Lygus hesperus TaxID=30085 RepID=A0A146L5B7_LYGHE
MLRHAPRYVPRYFQNILHFFTILRFFPSEAVQVVGFPAQIPLLRPPTKVGNGGEFAYGSHTMLADISETQVAVVTVCTDRHTSKAASTIPPACGAAITPILHSMWLSRWWWHTGEDHYCDTVYSCAVRKGENPMQVYLLGMPAQLPPYRVEIITQFFTPAVLLELVVYGDGCLYSADMVTKMVQQLANIALHTSCWRDVSCLLLWVTLLVTDTSVSNHHPPSSQLAVVFLQSLTALDHAVSAYEALLTTVTSVCGLRQSMVAASEPADPTTTGPPPRQELHTIVDYCNRLGSLQTALEIPSFIQLCENFPHV